MLSDAWPWQAIKQTYEDWELHHRAEVEFGDKSPAAEREGEESRAGRSITLEIASPDDEESTIWDFYSVTPLQVQMIKCIFK